MGTGHPVRNHWRTSGRSLICFLRIEETERPVRRWKALSQGFRRIYSRYTVNTSRSLQGEYLKYAALKKFNMSLQALDNVQLMETPKTVASRVQHPARMMHKA